MRGVSIIVMLALLVACGGEPHRAPVEDRRPGKAATAGKPRSYTVTDGDTLYAIAWRYGFDYRKLAQANAIAAPYRIYPGQALILSDKAAAGKKTAEVKKKRASVASKPASNSSRKGSGRAVKTSPATPALTSGPIRWRWPTNGKVVRGFSGTVHKGVDIDGQAGDNVRTVAAGRIVYAGSGIVGYGKLLIVKHSDIYLSAYGHNRRLLVEEGDMVNQGQKIAEKGSSATNSVKLHFEIRREGKPIDPAKLLPARK